MTDEAVESLLDALTGAPSLEDACAGLLTTARRMLGADVAGLVAWDAKGRLEHLATTDPELTTSLCDLSGGPICPPSAIGSRLNVPHLKTKRVNLQRRSRGTGPSSGRCTPTLRMIHAG